MSTTEAPTTTDGSSTGSSSAPSSSTSFIIYEPKPQPGGGKALAIALPTVFGVIVVTIIVIFIWARIRRNHDTSSVETGLEGDQKELDDLDAEKARERRRSRRPPSKLMELKGKQPALDAEESPADPEQQKDKRTETEDDLEEQREGEFGEAVAPIPRPTSHGRERSGSTPSSPTSTSPRSSHRQSQHRQSRRGSSANYIPDQFEDAPKTHKRSSKRPSVVLEKMPPP